MTYTLRPRANFSAGKFIAFARGELARRQEDHRGFRLGSQGLPLVWRERDADKGKGVCKKKQRAFSLIELMIVAAIIGILAALTIPALGRAKTRTRAMQCQNNVRQTMLASQIYLGENESFADPRGWWNDLAPSMAIDAKSLGPEAKIPLTHVWHCPGDEAFWTPQINYRFAYESYTFNSAGTGLAPGAGWFPLGLLKYDVSHSYLTPIRPTEIVAPSEMFVFGDAYAATMDGRIKRHLGPAVVGVNKVPDGDADWEWLRYFTHGRFNLACADGHAENLEPKKLHERSEKFWRRWNRDNEPHMDAMPSFD
jgi:prepilin-type N-terminal cleavage/methylation domain-containing protein